MHYCLTFPCIIVLYLLFDVHYFIRLVFAVSCGRIFKKRSKITEQHVSYGICLPSDVDIFFKHMNNARYLRELDFARSYYYDHTGLFGEIMSRSASVVQTATSIRYRRPINVFTTYKITTQLIYWDERSLYIEHEFVSLSDNFIRAVALSKQTISGSVTVPEILNKLEANLVLPSMTEELRTWCDSLEASSLRYRKLRENSEESGGPSDQPTPVTGLLETSLPFT